MVKRYMELGYQRVNGEYVKYTDYSKLEKRIEELEKPNHEFKCEMRAKENFLMEEVTYLKSVLNDAEKELAKLGKRPADAEIKENGVLTDGEIIDAGDI